MDKNLQIMDGCTAATYVAYAMSELAIIYPITPASDMGELADQWCTDGRKNIIGDTTAVKEMESEAGASGAVHGALCGGALTTTFTASQGLLLMIPNMYKMSGELLPAVFHVTARSLSAHALSIFGDHQDIMATRATGFAFLCSSSVQECMDLGLVAHLSAIQGSLPFCHFFDGFRTSSELEKIETIAYEDMAALTDWDAVRRFKARAMNSTHPDTRGTAQNPDVYFQNREAANKYHEALPSIVQSNMDKVAKLTGRSYHLFDYTGAPDAQYVIVAMGSACETISQTVAYLASQGEKVGAITVRLFRPFAMEQFMAAIPSTCTDIAVLNMTKEPGAPGEPLYQDVCTAVQAKGLRIRVSNGRYGLSSKDFTPSHVAAVLQNMQAAQARMQFTVGINDDVTHLSLPEVDIEDPLPKGTIQCKFYGFGSDGTISANRQATDIIGNATDYQMQAYFYHDSKKSEGYTVSHLRFSPQPIHAEYLIQHPDFVCCSKDSYLTRFDMLGGITGGGTFVINCPWKMPQLQTHLPASVKRAIARNHLHLYVIDAAAIAQAVGLGVRVNTIMETVFFKLVPLMDTDTAIANLKQSVGETYASKGQNVVAMNISAIDQALGALSLVQYPDSWANATDEKEAVTAIPPFVQHIAKPILAFEGNALPVSAFNPSGTFPPGTTAYEKRCVAENLPQWDVSLCIQCTQCSLVCAHAAIRPYLATAQELVGAPASYTTKPAVGKPFAGLSWRIQNYPEDCLGCGACANICPVGALKMVPSATLREVQKENLTFAQTHITYKDTLVPPTTVKGTQLQQPLLEFSGACAGCGETPYVKLLTQLFGKRMLIANATGCSSIWGASFPSMPYTVRTSDGRGPAWGNSLFEDAAEYGYGIAVATRRQRQYLQALVQELAAQPALPQQVAAAATGWLAAANDDDASLTAALALKEVLKPLEQGNALAKKIMQQAHLLDKQSVWVVGGDGWAYDIDFGGLDHVLASGENINMLVLDTECYSNTGGQMSKATPLGAKVQFASAGKRTNRKNLGRMFMCYGNVYVAAIAMGANEQQAVQALTEAQSYDGPSIVIAYAPCINHGIKRGMGTSMQEEQRAVSCGYWDLYRYDPRKIPQPLVVDSKAPSQPMDPFLDGEDRYAYLMQTDPSEAQVLRAGLAEDCKEQLQLLEQQAETKVN